MASSGTYSAWSPTLANLVEIASGRAGIDPASLNHRHIASAMAALNFGLRELESEDLSSFWRVDNESTVTVEDVATVSLAAGTIDIMNVTISDDLGVTDIPISRIAREQYFDMTTKATAGEPAMYWVNYESLAPVLTLYPVPDAVYTLKYDRLRHSQDATALSETPDIGRFWQDALAYNIAFRLAEEFNETRIARNEKRYYEMLEKAKGARIGRGPIVFEFKGFGRTGRRRRG